MVLQKIKKNFLLLKFILEISRSNVKYNYIDNNLYMTKKIYFILKILLLYKMHKLTEHFTLEELTYSYTAKQYNIDNRPNKFQISELTRLCKNILEPIRQKTGKPIIISSGYRCKELNDRIGGAKNSDHLYCSAVDCRCKGMTVKELFDVIVEMIKNEEIEVRQLIDENDYSWVHVSQNNKYNGYRKNQILHL